MKAWLEVGKENRREREDSIQEIEREREEARKEVEKAMKATNEAVDEAKKEIEMERDDAEKSVERERNAAEEAREDAQKALEREREEAKKSVEREREEAEKRLQEERNAAKEARGDAEAVFRDMAVLQGQIDTLQARISEMVPRAGLQVAEEVSKGLLGRVDALQKEVEDGLVRERGVREELEKVARKPSTLNPKP